MTGSVIGEPTPGFVTAQVKIRQKTYGKGYIGSTRSNEDIQFMNNRNAWIKMASSVFIKSKNRVPEGSLPKSDFLGENLATKAVLFNGLSSFNGSSQNLQQRGGTNTGPQYTPPSTSFYNNSAYGLGGNDFGILPMPGISSVSVDSKNRGSIKTATIQITAFNRYQFELIETLYCRLGFSMIVEWGWDKYIDNNGNYKLVEGTVTESKFFTSTNQDTIIKSLVDTSQKYHGNTGGLFGKVVNFNWKYNTDGSYQITVKITGMGDVIESMKINQSPSLALKESLQNLTATRYNLLRKAKSNIDANKTVTKLGTILYKRLNDDTLWRNGGNGNYFNLYLALKNSSYSSVVGQTDTMKIEYNYFIRFGELLNLIEKNITPDINNSPSIKFTKFDTNVDKVICSIQPNLISFDPAVCMIKMDTGLNLNQNDISGIEFPDYTSTMQDFTVIDGSTSSANAQPAFEVEIETATTSAGTGPPFPAPPVVTKTVRTVPSFSKATQTNGYTYEPIKGGGRVSLIQNNQVYEKILSQNPINTSGNSSQGDLLYGKILNIYLNYDMIFKTLSKNVDKKGNLTFFKFLQSMCDNINSAFANVIDIEPIIKDDKVITFMDTKPITGLSNNLQKVLPQISSDTAEFEIVGFNNIKEQGTFLKNISFNTKFSPKLASQLSIGATAGGVALGQDATGLSKWNSGLQDRYQIAINDPDAAVLNTTNTGNQSGNNQGSSSTRQGVGYSGGNEEIKKALFVNSVSILTDDSNGPQFPRDIDLGIPMIQEVYMDSGNLKKRNGTISITLSIDQNGKIQGSNFNTPPGYIPVQQLTQLSTAPAGAIRDIDPSSGIAFERGTNVQEELFFDNNNNRIDDPSQVVYTSYVKFDIEESVTDAPQNQAQNFLRDTTNGKKNFTIITEKILEGIALGFGVPNNFGVTDSTANRNSTSAYPTPTFIYTNNNTSGGTTAATIQSALARQLAGKNYSAYLAQMFGGQPTVSNAQAQASNMTITPVRKKDTEYTFRINSDSYAKAGKSSYKIYLDEASKRAAAANPNKIDATNQIGLLPIEFDMEMDGIAGFNIYNKIDINQRFLPSNYANSLDFLIKGINHKIDGSGWTTNLQTLSTSNLNSKPVTRNQAPSSGTTGRSTNVTSYNVDQNILDQVAAGTAVDDGRNAQRIPLRDREASAHLIQEIKSAESFVGRAYDDKKPSAILVASDVVNNNGSGNLRSRTGNPNNRGTLTIGYGFTRNVNDLSPLRSLEWDSTITQTQADDILDRAVKVQYHNLLKTPPRGLPSIADVPVTQGEYDALLSVVYNGGPIGNTSNRQPTPLNEALQNRQYAAAGEILKKYRLTQNGIYLRGLVNRRQAEYTIFIS